MQLWLAQTSGSGTPAELGTSLCSSTFPPPFAKAVGPSALPGTLEMGRQGALMPKPCKPGSIQPEANAWPWPPMDGTFPSAHLPVDCCPPLSPVWVSLALFPSLSLSDNEKHFPSGPRMFLGSQRLHSSNPGGLYPQGSMCILIANFCFSCGHHCVTSCMFLFILPWKVTGSSQAVSAGCLFWPRS